MQDMLKFWGNLQHVYGKLRIRSWNLQHWNHQETAVHGVERWLHKRMYFMHLDHELNILQ